MGEQVAAQFARGQDAAVEAETMAIGPGGEAVAEEAVEVFGANADAVVGDGNAQAVVAVPVDADGQDPFRRG